VVHLRSIATSENITIDDDALELIAEHGEGSFRDSISLLDQASSTSDHVTRADIERVLGLAPTQTIGQLHDAIVTYDSHGAVTALETLYSGGYEPAAIAAQLSATLRSDVLSGSAEAARLLAILQQLLDIAGARNPRQLLEIATLRACLPVAGVSNIPHAPAMVATPPAASKPSAQASATTMPAQTAKSAAQPVSPTSKPAETAPRPPVVPAQTPPAEAALPSISAANLVTDADVLDYWQDVLNEIKKQYNTLYGIARMAKPQLQENTLTLAFKFAFHQKRLNEVKNRQIFSDVATRLRGTPTEIVCVVLEPDTASAPADVSAVSNIFGGAELLES
jgi:DNA polymerase-3 subunit gamma/tau